jgi:hypothetical protein
MFEYKNVKIKLLFVFLAVVSLCLVGTGKESPAETSGKSIADQTIERLKTPLEKELGDIKVGMKYEKREIFGTVVGFDCWLEKGKLDSTWGEKVVRVLNTLGATGAQISARSDSGPTEVRAESLKVGEKEATSVQCVPSSDGYSLGWSLMFPSGLLKK